MADDYYPLDDDQQQPQRPPPPPQPPEGFEPYQPPVEAKAAPPEGFEPYQPPKPPEGFEPYEPPTAPSPDTPRPPAPEERRGVVERAVAGFKGGFGEEPLGFTPENQAKYPATRVWQPLVAGVDATLRAAMGAVGGVAGAAAGLLERPEVAPTTPGGYRLPDISSPFRLNRAEADRAQRDFTIFGQAALIEPAMGAAAMRPRAIPRSAEPPAARPPAEGIPEPPSFRPGETAQGQREMFVPPELHQTEMPMGRGRGEAPPRQLEMPVEGDMRGGARQGELPLGDEAAQRRQGQTAGADASAGVAQEPRPPTAEPVSDPQNKTTLGTGAKETGGENLNTRDYGKKAPAATGEASGVNITKNGVDPTLAHTINPDTTAAVPPVRQPAMEAAPRPAEAAPAPAGLLPEKQPFYEAAKAEAPNLPPEQLTHIANLAGGPKGAALMARNAARRMAEDVGAPAARIAEAERAQMPSEAAPLRPGSPEAQAAIEAFDAKPAPVEAPAPVKMSKAERQKFDYAVKEAMGLRLRNGIQPTDPAIAAEIARRDARKEAQSTARTQKIQEEVAAGRPAPPDVRPVEAVGGTTGARLLQRGFSKEEVSRTPAARAQEILAGEYTPQEARARGIVKPGPVEAALAPIPGSKAAQRAEAAHAVEAFEARKAAAREATTPAPEKLGGEPVRLDPELARRLIENPKLLKTEAAKRKMKSNELLADANDAIGHGTTQFAPQEQFGGQAPPKITPDARPIEPTGRPVPEGARAEVNKLLDQTMSAENPATHLRETATRARELGLEGQARRIETAAAEMERQRTVEIAPGPGERSTGTLRQQQEGILDRVRGFIADERGGGRVPRTPAEEKILSRLAPEPGLFDNLPKGKEEVSSAWRNFYTGFKNALDPIEQLKHRSLTNIPVHEDPGVLARLTKGLGGRLNQVFKDGTYDVRSRKITGDPLQTVLDKIAADPDGFTAYAMARTAIERDNYSVKTGIPLKEANEVIAQTGAKWGPISNELSAFKNRMLDSAVDILGPEAITAMKAKYPGHIPLHRVVDPKSATGQALGTGLQARNPLFKLKGGSELPILHPLDSIIKDTAVLLDMAERNRVGLSMKALNDKLGPNSKFMREVKDVHPIEITAAEVNKHLGVEGITEQVADGFKVFRRDAFTPAPDRIRVFEDGKAKVYEVPENVGKAFGALDHESLGMVTKILGAPARWLRAGSVLTPEFIVKNLMRDQIAAFTQAKGFVPGFDTATGLKNLLPGKSSEAFQRWQIEGGANSNLVSMDRKIMTQDPRTALQHVSNVVTKPYQWLQMASEVAENATRLGVYERAIKRGEHPIAATFEAREGTLDFQRMGSHWIQKALNQIIPFYNVAIEGTDRTIRAFRDRPGETALKTAVGITLPSVAIWAATKDDERVQQVERWQKDLAWIIPGKDNWVPISTQGRNEILDNMGLKAEGLDLSKLTHTFRKMPDGSFQYNNGNIWRVPKPPGIGQLFGSIPERILDAYVKHDPTAYKDLGKTVWQAFAPSITPQIALPAIEQWANKSFFLDRSLVSQSLQKLPTSQQITPQTSEVAKDIAGVVRKIAGGETALGSPIIVDNYIRAYTGGLGKHVTDLLDLGMRDKNAPPKPEMSLADTPLIKAFAVRHPSSGAPAIQQFYDTYNERKVATAGVKNLQKKDQPADPNLMREPQLQGIYNALGAGTKTINKILNDKNMSPADKRAAMDLTYLFMIEKAKQGNAAFERTSKRHPTAPEGFEPYQPEMQ